MRGYTPEYILSRQVSNYLQIAYPLVLFHYDLSGLHHTKTQAGMAKAVQCCKGWPDLFIAEARGSYAGLFIELKAEGVKLYKRDNVTFVSDHVAEQFKMLVMLSDRGYMAEFAVGFDKAKYYIDAYLSLKRP